MTNSIAIVVSVACLLSSCAYSQENAGPGNIYPQGSQLLFSAYSIKDPELSLAKAAGFTAIGPYYGKDKPRALEYSEQAGLPVIYSVGPKFDFSANESAQEAALDAIAEEVRRIAEHKNVVIWNLGNEELRHWKQREMDWLSRITAIIRDNDPMHRPIMMYEPNHRQSEQLLITGEHLDLVSKGSYSNYVGMKTQRSWLRWSLDQTLAAAEKTGGTPLAVLWMARDQKSAREIDAIPGWVKHDVYLSLVSGAKGIIVFSAFNKRRGFRKHFSKFYQAYAKAAGELNGSLQLGQVFLFGTPQQNLTIEHVSGPREQKFKYREAMHTYPSVHHLHNKHDDANYLFIVNSANSDVSISISGAPAGTKALDLFAQTNSKLPDRLTLQPLEVRAYRWK